jgi:hypothetical protein
MLYEQISNTHWEQEWKGQKMLYNHSSQSGGKGITKNMLKNSDGNADGSKWFNVEF